MSARVCSRCGVAMMPDLDIRITNPPDGLEPGIYAATRCPVCGRIELEPKP